jgi:hypothetical protein
LCLHGIFSPSFNGPKEIMLVENGFEKEARIAEKAGKPR